jgi:hypothetical protein
MMRNQRRLKELSAKILDLEAQLVAERAEREKWEWAAKHARQRPPDVLRAAGEASAVDIRHLG